MLLKKTQMHAHAAQPRQAVVRTRAESAAGSGNTRLRALTIQRLVALKRNVDLEVVRSRGRRVLLGTRERARLEGFSKKALRKDADRQHL